MKKYTTIYIGKALPALVIAHILDLQPTVGVFRDISPPEK